MQVTQEQLNPCEIELSVEVEAETVNTAVEDTYKEFAKFTNVPGFRKGKAPRALLERVVSVEKIKEHAADIVLRDAYAKALEETKIDPFAPADVELVKFEIGEPLVFKAKVPLAPKVEVGEYVGIEVERKVQQVTDEDVENEVQQILGKHAEFPEITDRPAMEGDTAILDMKDEREADAEPKRNVAVIGDNLPDLDKALTGMALDEEKVIDVTYPEDHASEDLRGQTIPIRTKLIKLHERKLPELNDEWVKQTFAREPEEGVDPDPDAVDSADKLRARIKSEMEKAAAQEADAEVENKIITEVVARSTVNFPDVMVEEEAEERLAGLQEELKTRKLSLDDYLKHSGQSAEQLHEDMKESARKMLTTTLVLHEIIEKENLKVEDADVEAEVQAMSVSHGVPIESIRAYVDRTGMLQKIRNRVLQKKVMDFLTHASNTKNVGDEAPAK